jgi:hypothetical protein
MAQSDGPDKRAARTREHVGNVDQRIASPSERAKLVWDIIRTHAPELTDWDVICFSAEYLGMMVNVQPWLEIPVKEVSKLVYTAHYLTPDVDVSSSIKRAEAGEPLDTKQGSNASEERKADSPGVIRTRFSFGGSD